MKLIIKTFSFVFYLVMLLAACESVVANSGDKESQIGYKLGEECIAKLPRGNGGNFRIKAEQGNASSQFTLGSMYENGSGYLHNRHDMKNAPCFLADRRVLKSYVEAFSWYHKAAVQNHEYAQYSLAQLYYSGKGTPQNYTEAVKWYLEAAAQNNAGSQKDLGDMYYYGEGIPRNIKESYIWYSIATANEWWTTVDHFSKSFGRKDVTYEIDIRKRRDEIAKLLSPADLSFAQSESLRRHNSIQNKQWRPAPISSANAAVVAEPQGVNIAERVFENTWRSVIVIRNGDSQGSGVIIRPNVVATNCHVVDGESTIIVYKSKNRSADTSTPFVATIHRADARQDFCLLNVDGLWGVPTTVRQYSTLKVGEDVYGLGAPSGLGLSLSSGLISQLRENEGVRIIQTDAAISPGSSGGGLFDREGNLVGITTFKFIGEDVEGLGFAIPADIVLAY